MAVTREDIIRKVGSRWVLYSHAGRRLGVFKSRQAALARERQIAYFKHRDYREDNRQRTVQLIRARRSLGLTSKRRRIPQQIPPRAIELEYTKELLRVVALVKESIGELMRELPHLLASAARERKDAGEGRRVRELIGMAERRLSSALTTSGLDELAERFGRRTTTYNRVQLSKQIIAVVGADVFSSDRRVGALLEGFASENVALIKDLSAKLLGEVERSVTRAITSGQSTSELTAEIQERIGVGESRARLIARDQINKLYGQVNAERQKDLGITRFIWRTARDERVRPEHAEREGNVYSYAEPPDGELPGEPIQCRCYAEPVFEDILNEV